jgi:hypothetical protein
VGRRRTLRSDRAPLPATLPFPLRTFHGDPSASSSPVWPANLGELDLIADVRGSSGLPAELSVESSRDGETPLHGERIRQLQATLNGAWAKARPRAGPLSPKRESDPDSSSRGGDPPVSLWRSMSAINAGRLTRQRRACKTRGPAQGHWASPVRRIGRTGLSSGAGGAGSSPAGGANFF